MAIVLEQIDDKMCVRLDGPIDIAVAEELRRGFLDALASGSSVVVDCGGATYLDVTAVQILWAAQQEATARHTSMVFALPIPDAIRSALADVGLERVLAAPDPPTGQVAA